jgi:hypothetical protein
MRTGVIASQTDSCTVATPLPLGGSARKPSPEACSFGWQTADPSRLTDRTPLSCRPRGPGGMYENLNTVKGPIQHLLGCPPPERARQGSLRVPSGHSLLQRPSIKELPNQVWGRSEAVRPGTSVALQVPASPGNAVRNSTPPWRARGPAGDRHGLAVERRLLY